MYPGAVRRCPNGCPEHAPGDEDGPPPVMPDYAPDCGYWFTCCIFCGWRGRYVPRYGDRAQDICWVIDEDLTPAEAARASAYAERVRAELGMDLK